MKQIILPEEKLNELAQEVSARLVNRHYFEQGTIKGDELKSFASHQQVNKFLLFQVYQVWEMQINKLYHPYFNLEAPEIKQTVETLKNQISQQIIVKEEDFQPLLKRAVYNNLKLLLSPKDTFESFFFAQTDKISLQIYQRYAQFFSDLDFIVNSILRYHQKAGMEQVEKDVFFLKMEKAIGIFDRKSGQTFDSYREDQFKALTGQDMSSVEHDAKRLLEEIERKKQEEEAQARQKEEESRRKEAEAKKKAEEARRKEEEARRKAEEEAKRKEEEAKKTKISFFDSLESGDNFFDLDDEEEAAAPTPKPQAEVKPPADTQPVQKQVQEPKAEVEQKPAEKEEAPAPSITPVATTPDPVKVEEVKPEAAPTVHETMMEAEAEEPKFEWRAPADPPTPTPIEVDKKPIPDLPKEAPANVDHAKEEKPKTLLDRFNKGNGVKEEEPEPQSKTGTSVLDRLKGKAQNAGDQLADAGAKVLKENLNGNRKIRLDEIPIHKQYQYVQKVFDGNNVRFRIIVDKINNAKDKDETEEILEKFVLSNAKLNREDPVVQEFISLLRNRF